MMNAMMKKLVFFHLFVVLVLCEKSVEKNLKAEKCNIEIEASEIYNGKRCSNFILFGSDGDTWIGMEFGLNHAAKLRLWRITSDTAYINEEMFQFSYNDINRILQIIAIVAIMIISLITTVICVVICIQCYKIKYTNKKQYPPNGVKKFNSESSSLHESQDRCNPTKSKLKDLLDPKLFKTQKKRIFDNFYPQHSTIAEDVEEISRDYYHC